MTRLWAPFTILLLLLATACTSRSASTPISTGAIAPAPAPDQMQAGTAAWTHPMDVAPLTQPVVAADSVGGKAAGGAGTFKIISDTPWPGEKVRVFFFGVQA